MKRLVRWWTPVAQIGVHTLVGLLIYLIIAVPAVLLGMAIEYLGKLNLPGFTLAVLEVLEHGILLVDTLLFVVYVGVTGIKAFREILEDAQEED